MEATKLEEKIESFYRMADKGAVQKVLFILIKTIYEQLDENIKTMIHRKNIISYLKEDTSIHHWQLALNRARFAVYYLTLDESDIKNYTPSENSDKTLLYFQNLYDEHLDELLLCLVQALEMSEHTRLIATLQLWDKENFLVV